MSLRAFLTRPGVRQHPVRFLRRRLQYEFERRLWPSGLRRERIGELSVGPRMRLRTGEIIERTIYLYGMHEFTSASAFSQLLRPGDNVVDIGSHSGQYALIAAAVVGANGRVLAIDANPSMLERLRKNADLNGFGNIETVNVAASDTARAAELYYPANSEWSEGIASLSATEGWSSMPVQTSTIDQVVSQAKLSQIDVIKLDVEGHELAALRGATDAINAWHPVVLLEVNGLNTDHWPSTGSLAWLLANGYVLFGLSSDSAGCPSLRRLSDDQDLNAFREPWSALNLVAMPEGSDRWQFE